jgi:N-acetylglutamate synthase-like GNAT family acetyltransferase
MKIERIKELPDISNLSAESEREGFRFLRRLIKEFESGENRFDCTGEALFGVFDSGDCIAIGGVNRDPFSSSGTGRVRRVYVSVNRRSEGIGQKLMNQIEIWSRKHFGALTLFTDTDSASEFYETIGYSKVSEEKVSHVKTFIT